MRYLCCLFFWLFAQTLFAQAPTESSYISQIARHRENYKAEFLKELRSPLKTDKDLTYLRFYDPDSTCRVEATVQRTPNAEPFDMPTYDGQKQPYVQYATLSFLLNGQSHQLAIYRSLRLIQLPQYRDYLFVPFKDATNGKHTYGGGRYLDFRLGDIKDGKLTLDFNKAYNPYCAYSDGYACPIPPKINWLSVAIQAGEKEYGKAH